MPAAEAHGTSAAGAVTWMKILVGFNTGVMLAIIAIQSDGIFA